MLGAGKEEGPSVAAWSRVLRQAVPFPLSRASFLVLSWGPCRRAPVRCLAHQPAAGWVVGFCSLRTVVCWPSEGAACLPQVGKQSARGLSAGVSRLRVLILPPLSTNCGPFSVWALICSSAKWGWNSCPRG